MREKEGNGQYLGHLRKRSGGELKRHGRETHCFMCSSVLNVLREWISSMSSFQSMF